MTVTIHHGDCLEVMARMIDEGVQVDGCLTDPPYHLNSIVKRFSKSGGADRPESRVGAYARTARGFMGKEWDGGDIAFRQQTWDLVFALLKPGAYIIAFGGSRTYHRMACAIEDAGFIVHPLHGWIYGQGFPKAHNPKIEGMEGWRHGGQTFKPALEPMFMGQKPMEGTGRANILKYGTGAINIEACRVRTTDATAERDGETTQDARYDLSGSTNFAAKPGRRYKVRRLKAGATLEKTGGNWRPNEGPMFEGELGNGRWPANVAHDGSPDVVNTFPQTDGQGAAVTGEEPSSATSNIYGAFNGRPPSEPRGDTGSAARFFYCAKADKNDRCGSAHPTIKPVDLIAYYARAITPIGGRLLDPFAGSGTLGMAAMREGFDAVLIEREAEYVADIRRRIAHVHGTDSPLFAVSEAS